MAPHLGVRNGSYLPRLGRGHRLNRCAYNRTLLGALAAAERLGRWWFVDVRAALVGAVVGLLAWFGPGLVGGGDAITQRTLAGGDSMMLVGGVFLIRFGLGPSRTRRARLSCTKPLT
jgi:chloride channel protein, CIC family